jgi:mono/diheme cytochrome c family protein
MTGAIHEHGSKRSRARRWGGGLLLAIAVVVVLCVAAWRLTAEPDNSARAGAYPGTPDAALVAQGAYVARLGDCAACHTAVGGRAYAGGLAVKSPIGTIYSSNVTPDPATGIGRYSFDDFDRAVRHGIRKDGVTLYPAMPYPAFARMTDTDMRALYAYFMKGVAPVVRPNTANDIPWPISMRWPLAIWRRLFALPPAAVATVAAADPVVTRGEYIVTGPGHCGSCHTPRGLALQEKAADARGGPAFLAGGAVIDGWVVPGLRGNARDGLGNWSEHDIALFLKTGRVDHTAVFGGMTDVVAWSTQHFTQDDAIAVARYLKTLPGSAPDQHREPLADAGRAPYAAHCAVCHGSDGTGVPRMFPSLNRASVIASENPQSLIKIILKGATLPPTNRAQSAVSMPGFADRLSDQQVADIVNYIRTDWGNAAPANATPKAVAAARKSMGTPGASQGGWAVFQPQPTGSAWTFAPQSHAGKDEAK